MVVDMKGHRQEFENEEGYVLLAVIFLTVILLISLAIAAPKIAKSIQRDKDLETIHRGEQYKRAIKLYYQKFGSYPTSIDQLVETNQMRFLRKKYTDPETGKDDWKPVLFGQAHVRPLGFFGQPLMMAGAMAGAGSMYAVSATTTTDANGVPIASGDTSGTDALAGNSGTGTGLGSTSPSQGSQNGISSMFAQTSTTSGHGFADGFAHRNEWDRDVGDDVRRRRTDCGVYAAGGQAVAGRLQAANAVQQVGIQLRSD